VCASVLGMAIALFFGIAAAFWVGWVAYAVAAIAMVIAVRGRNQVATELDPKLELGPEMPAPVDALR